MTQRSGKWTARDVPDQHGRIAVITGANSGIGLETAKVLAARGALLVLAGRDAGRTLAAAGQVRAAASGAKVETAELDLASLDSVRAAAADIAGRFERLDLLINNAGVMFTPHQRTQDGFELQFGTNHLGHFALTGLLLPALLNAPAPRVVTVSSTMHRGGTMDFDDLNGEHKYSRWGAYSQSKLANLMFCFELQRRATAADSPLLSLAAHPGYANTNLQFAAPDRFYEKAFMWIGNHVFAQSADMGALPTLYAATVPGLPGGTYVGPGGRGEQRGHPKVVTAAGKAYDEAAWRRLWEVSEELTGVHYEFVGAPA
jgi:NAD(P)-dependent dehydrogenase (short-subunit alcohol dehydrogenase family)